MEDVMVIRVQKAAFQLKILLLLTISIWSCQSSIEEEKLPYYNSAQFTPLWIHNTDSIAQLHQIAPFEFRDQLGKKVNQNILNGKIYVANFFFTTCTSICPRMTENMDIVYRQFKNDSTIVLLSHTVMPWVDSVSVLNEYATLRGIESPKWCLLTGSKDSIYELAKKSYFVEEDLPSLDSNEFLHTEKFILVDKNRHIRGIYNGTLQLEAQRLIEDILLLKKEK